MATMKNKKIFFVLLIASLLVLSVAFTGCTEDGSDENGTDDGENGEDDNGEDDEYVGTGTETFSGTWEGEDASGQDQYEGTWEFTVDWENEDVSGSFDGDAEGDDLTGSVSDGEITAEGEAGLGYITWEGSFSADGSSVSGTWEIEESGYTAYSGTWTGSVE